MAFFQFGDWPASVRALAAKLAAYVQGVDS